MTEEISTDYKYLVGRGFYTEEYLFERMFYWLRKAQKIIRIFHLESVARVDNRRLCFMVLSYFADIARLKDFHPNIKKTRRVTTFAYSFYWFLKVAPIQLLQELPPDKQNVNNLNEITVVGAWAAEFLQTNKLSRPRLDRYIKELLYYFKYRTYTAQNLEAILTAFLLGAGEDPFYEKESPPVS